MSRAATDWAFLQRPKSPRDRLVLLVLANHADRLTDAAWPSVAAIIEASGLDRKTVLASLASLERAGLIVDSGARMGRTLQVKVWRLGLTTREG